MTRVVCFGELMLRLSPPGHERLFQSPRLRTYFGGSEANVAASLAHFGVESEYVTRLPANAIGDAAMAALRAEGVGVAGVIRGGPRMGLYFVEPGADLRAMRVVYDRAHSSFSALSPRELDWATLLRGAHWLHLTGITPALGDGPATAAADAVRTARDAGVPVSVDLNYRPALWAGRDPRPLVQPLVEGCDTLIGNPGAMRAMLGIDVSAGGDDPLDAIRRIAELAHAQLGCRRVALTRRDVLSASEHGWTAALWDADGGALHSAQHHVVRVVDRVGGGDSFAAALIHAHLSGRGGADAVRFATAASALKLTIPGDFNRVTVDEVDQILPRRE